MKLRGPLLMVLAAMLVIMVGLFTKVGTKGSAKAPIQSQVDALLESRQALTQANLRALQNVIASYAVTEGRIPAAVQDVRAAGMLAVAPQDAWGRDFRYERRSDSSFRLTSAGPDGAFDTADDIRLDY
jgi:hypothetical protein